MCGEKLPVGRITQRTVLKLTMTAKLPPLRRIVTGHSDEGKAVIDSDKLLEPFDPRLLVNQNSQTEVERSLQPGGGFIHIFRTESFPASNQGEWTEFHEKAIPLCDQTGTTMRVVDMPPGTSSPLHRTITVDLGVVLKGEVVLELDDKVEVTVHPGETIVQRGTIHAWHNRGDSMARILFVLVPAERIEVRGMKLEPTRFGVN